MIFALYMVILLYGQMVATNVATEKSSRAMEVLITSAKPVAMMFGKVISSCLAGLTQLLCVFGTALLCYRLTSSDWDGNPIVSSLFGIPPYLLGYMLLFFLLGFLLYAFLFGAVGSTATMLEDINTSVMPITLVFVLAFLVVLPAMTSGTVDSPLMIVCSFLPFHVPHGHVHPHRHEHRARLGDRAFRCHPGRVRRRDRRPFRENIPRGRPALWLRSQDQGYFPHAPQGITLIPFACSPRAALLAARGIFLRIPRNAPETVWTARKNEVL